MNKHSLEKKKPMVTRIARKIGECSAEAACAWWINQPKLPESMKKSSKD